MDEQVQLTGRRCIITVNSINPGRQKKKNDEPPLGSFVTSRLCRESLLWTQYKACDVSDTGKMNV